MDDTYTETQSSTVNDFFSDKDGVANDSGSQEDFGSEENAQSESITDAPQAKKPGMDQNQQTQGQNQQPGEQPEKGKEEVKKPEFDADGAEALLWNTDDQGNTVFNLEKALELAKPDTKVFEGATNPQSQQQVQQQPQAAEDTRPAWQKRLDERAQQEKQYVDNLTMYERFLTEGASAGYNGQQLLQYAREKVQNVVRHEMERARYEEDERAREEMTEKIAKEREFAELKPRSQSILQALNREVGGKLDQLLLGYQKDGKYVEGVGTKDVNMLFELMNPEAKKIKDAGQLQQAYSDWWLKVSSDERSIRWLTNIARQRLLEKSIPHILKKQRLASEQQARNLGEGNSRPPGKTNIQQSTGNETADAFDQWLKAAPGKKVDHIG